MGRTEYIAKRSRYIKARIMNGFIADTLAKHFALWRTAYGAV